MHGEHPNRSLRPLLLASHVLVALVLFAATPSDAEPPPHLLAILHFALLGCQFSAASTWYVMTERRDFRRALPWVTAAAFWSVEFCRLVAGGEIELVPLFIVGVNLVFVIPQLVLRFVGVRLTDVAAPRVEIPRVRQFSLRTVFIATAVVAVLMAIGCWAFPAVREVDVFARMVAAPAALGVALSIGWLYDQASGFRRGLLIIAGVVAAFLLRAFDADEIVDFVLPYTAMEAGLLSATYLALRVSGIRLTRLDPRHALKGGNPAPDLSATGASPSSEASDTSA